LISKVLAIIPARYGSKGIKHKNIRDVGGKPLLYYQIKNALDSKLVDTVVVSSNSAKILGIANDLFGNRIRVHLRTQELATDTSKAEETMLDVLKTVLSQVVVLLEPTNPLNRPEYIDSCIQLVLNGYDSCCCVTEDFGFLTDDNRIMERPMKQDIQPRLRETGNCWVVKADVLRETHNRLGGKRGYVIIPKRDSIHLDNEDDWLIAETLMGKDYYVSRNGHEDYREGYWAKADPDGNYREMILERDKQVAICKEQLDYLNQYSGRVLDYGCGFGFFLSGLDNKWEKFGFEPSDYAREEAERYGSIVKEMDFPDDMFEAIILNHVIEHLPDPVGAIKDIRRMLRPEGKLVITTPDFNSAVAQRFQERFRLLNDKGHISLFSLLGLYQLLKDNLFNIERVTYPFFETEYFTEENLMRLFDTDKVSPPFAGNVMTFYAYKK